MFNRKYIFKCGMFHCHVSFGEESSLKSNLEPNYQLEGDVIDFKICYATLSETNIVPEKMANLKRKEIFQAPFFYVRSLYF